MEVIVALIVGAAIALIGILVGTWIVGREREK